MKVICDQLREVDYLADCGGDREVFAGGVRRRAFLKDFARR
jgi:hypothetical protein